MEVQSINSLQLVTGTSFPTRSVSQHSLHESRKHLLLGNFIPETRYSQSSRGKLALSLAKSKAVKKSQCNEWPAFLLASIAQQTLDFINMTNSPLQIDQAYSSMYEILSALMLL
ncbi:hypothetical protein Ciccas_010591 [Cichlidogyrus casuarinus]|uniref:Uncharacterized protein n=1 Tax=Cichlidogyrus casuarinus TaxID=1844966 RepID=A0ABD2PYC0_9PLAT